MTSRKYPLNKWQNWISKAEEAASRFSARYGVPVALRVARGLHVGAAAGFALFGWSAQLGSIYWGALAVVLVVLVLEQKMAQHPDTVSINRAFFNANAVVSLVLLLGVCLALWARNQNKVALLAFQQALC